MRHCTILLISNIGLLCPLLLAQTSISLSSATASPGATLSLGLSIATSGTAPTGLQWTLTYPATQVSSFSVTSGPSATAAGKTVTCAYASGSSTCLVTGLNTNTMTSGVAAYVNVTLAPTASTTSVAISNPVAASSSGTGISISSATGGVITVTTTVTTVSSLSCTPAALGHGASSTCTVSLNSSAPAGGSVVTLSSNNPLLTVPASVTVAGGATTAMFSATAGATITSNQSAIVTANLGSSSQTATISLTASAGVQVSSLVCTPASLGQSGVSTCTVALTSAAPAGGSVITLSSNNALLTVPASVTVAAGAATATFSATAGANITSNQSITVTANLGSSSQTATISLTAPVTSVPSFVQETAALNGTANPSIISLSAASTSGNLIIVAVTHDNQRANVSSITDNKGNTYTRAISGMDWGTNGNQARSELWYAANITGGGTPVAATVSLSASPNSFVQLHISEYSGLATTAPLDQVSHTSAKGSFNGTFSTASTVTTSANELVFGHCEMWSGTVGAGAGFTARSTFGGNIEESENVSSTGSYAASCTENGSGPMAMMATFKASSATPSLRSVSSLEMPGKADVPSSAGSANTDPGSQAGTAQDLLKSLSCSPNTVSAGSLVSCELRLTPKASTAAANVESSSDQVRIPAAVNTRPNQSSLTFQARVDPMVRTGSVVITASLGGGEVQDSIHTVSAPRPVVAAPEKISGKIGIPVNFTVRASDPADLPLELSATGLPSGAVFDPVRGRFTWVPDPSQAGNYKITFTATNPTGQSSSAQVSLDAGRGLPVLDQAQVSSCSPGSVASLGGEWLAATNSEVSQPDGTSFELGGTRVNVNGQEVPVLYSSASRVDFLCPQLDPGTQLSVTVETDLGTSAPWASVMNRLAPRILAVSDADSSQLVLQRDYTESGHPAQPGDEIVLSATGFGSMAATPGAVLVRLGDLEARVDSVDAVPGQAGVYAIHCDIPSGTAFGAEPLELHVVAPGGQDVSSNRVEAAIEPVH